MAAGCDAGAAPSLKLAPHLWQNGAPIDGVPHLLQNLAAGGGALTSTGATGGGAEAVAAGAASGVSAWGGGLAANRVSAPHLLQKIPLTGAPHLLQKFAMLNSPVTRLRLPLCRSAAEDAHRTAGGDAGTTKSCFGFQGGRPRGRLESI